MDSAQQPATVTLGQSDSRCGTPSLRVVSLFAGIGGFELGLQKAGHEILMGCEIDPGAQAVLSAKLKCAGLHSDITQLRSLPASTTLLTAGFPCQDLSQAGACAGIDGKRSGLIEHVFRLLERKRVEWVLLENVPFLRHLHKGRGLRFVLGELERLGYSWAYRVIDTRSFGLPQRRERLFILASRCDDPRNVLLSGNVCYEAPRPNSRSSCGFYWSEGNQGFGWAENAVPTLKGGTRGSGPTPPAVLRGDGRIVIPDIRDAERLQGFPAGWTEAAEQFGGKGHRWRLVGNAVSVPVARWIGSRLASSPFYDHSQDEPLEGSSWPAAAWNIGRGVHVSKVSSFPSRVKRSTLANFLEYPGSPLSETAARGFLCRLLASSLNPPDRLIQALQDHLAVSKIGPQRTERPRPSFSPRLDRHRT